MDETTLEPLVASELDPLELAHQLKERAEIIGEAQQTQLSRLDSLSQLKQRLAEVRMRHGEMQAELQRATALSPPHALPPLREEKQASPSEIKIKMEATVAANMRKRKQTLMGQAFSLAGIRVLPYPGNRLLLVLGSSYQGQYFDKRYHIWLETDKGATNKLRVFKHTVPYFIPIKQLEEQHLAKNIRYFVRAVSLYMNAFVARRGQVVELNRQADIESVETSAAFDYVCFSFASGQHGQVQVNLKFDLMRTRPSEVEATFMTPLKTRNKSVRESEARERREWKQRVEELMRSHPLVEAYTQLFAQVPDTSVLY